MLANHDSVDVIAVYTQPDRTAGRGQKLHVGEVKTAAIAHNLTLEQPLNWRDDRVVAQFARYAPDLLIVAAYGLILPASALAISRYGALNVHASVLPHWRGAAPIQRAIMAGDRESGVTIMQVIPALDAGPILRIATCPIAESDTAGSLSTKLAELGARALCEVLAELDKALASAVPQAAAGVTYAAKLTSDDRGLDWREPALVLQRKIRALNPAPLAVTEVVGLPVNIRAAVAMPALTLKSPGTILAWTRDGIDIATTDGKLRLLELQPAGKRVMAVREFINGYRQPAPAQ